MEHIQFDELVADLMHNRESEYIEFKISNDNPSLFGETVCALANGAVLADKQEAYLIYGINDNGDIVGTSFDPHKNIRSQPFINLISTNLQYADELTYRIGEIDKKRIVIVIIPRARMYPVEYKGIPYIRIDSAKKKLREHPEVARRLWETILKKSFEDGYSTDLVNEKEIFELLDVIPYYKKRGQSLPENKETIIKSMLNDGILAKKIGKYYITNLGALLFAKKLSYFKNLINREIRIIKYKANNKIEVERSIDFDEGYAICADRVLDSIKLLLPNIEYMDGAQRKERPTFPDDALRELLANMLIHQDFSIEGYCPRIEIYNDRIEFTNSGSPIIDISRFLDLNRSRNPKLARVARFIGMCEERGMGIDKVEYACEKSFLPSPSPSSSDGITRVILFGHKSLRQFNKNDRINLVYMHCCFQYINQMHLTNESLRSRFPSGTMSTTVASRWIKEALEYGAISKFDTGSSRKNTSYVPRWAT